MAMRLSRVNMKPLFGVLKIKSLKVVNFFCKFLIFEIKMKLTLIKYFDFCFPKNTTNCFFIDKELSNFAFQLKFESGNRVSLN